MVAVPENVYQASLNYLAADLSGNKFSCKADFMDIDEGILESDHQTPQLLGIL